MPKSVLPVRHHTSRQGQLAARSFFKTGHRLEIAIKAAKIRMPWQKARGFEWVPGPWMGADGVGISPIELTKHIDHFQKVVCQAFGLPEHLLTGKPDSSATAR